MLSRYQEQDSK